MSAPSCATADKIEMCVHETMVRRYGPSPLEQARKLLDKTDARAAAGLAFAIVAVWRFIQRRRKKCDDRKIENEEQLVVLEVTEGEVSREWLSEPRIDDQCLAAGEGKTASQVVDELVRPGQSLTKPENAGTKEVVGKESGPVKRVSEGVHELAKTKRALEIDLEDSAAERRAAEEDLRRSVRHKLQSAERGGPASSPGTPTSESTSATAGDSPVAVLLAKAKATSEKADRIHARLRRLSKGDAPK